MTQESRQAGVGTTGIHEPTIQWVMDWLHGVEAAWIVEQARRDGVPEHAADRLADELESRWLDQ
jgi:hypothetical protein